jgi:DNA polymerase-3 subunit beta
MLSAGVEQERPVAQGAATMEITVSRQDLLRELSATQSVVERKTTIPILSNFLLEASQGRATAPTASPLRPLTWTRASGHPVPPK